VEQQGDFQKNIEKTKGNYCVLAVEQISGGRTDGAVKNGRIGSYTWCGNNIEKATSSAINSCAKSVGRQCVVAYTYDRQSNRYESFQAKNIQDIENEKRNSLVKKCDGYGFKQGTTEHANCMMNVEQQMEATEIAWRIEQNKIQQQNLETIRKAAKDLNPQIIQPVCPGMLNARPNQYGQGCN
jgi:hypothetical protein